MRAKLVAGNWKMNGNLASSQALIAAILPKLSSFSRARYTVCVPYPYLVAAGRALAGSNVVLGAQDVSQFDDGAYTGAVEARSGMLRKADKDAAIAPLVILGTLLAMASARSL